MNRRILCAWDSYRHAVSHHLEPSSNAYPIPTWQANTPFNQSQPISVWGTISFVPRISNVEKLRQFCESHPPSLTSQPLQNFRLLKNTYLHCRYVRQFVLSICASVAFCLYPPQYSSSPTGDTLQFDSSTQTLSTNPSLPELKPQVSLTTSILGKGATANAQTPNPLISRTTSPQFIHPVAGFPLTSQFGNRVHPISGDIRFHEGVDFGTPPGTPIKAAKPGTVAFAGWHGGYGKTVIMQHSAEYETLYAHLDEVWVTAGDRVAQGKVIGLSGDTGYATGPHLHFEIRAGQVARNPMDYLPSLTTAYQAENPSPARIQTQ